MLAESAAGELIASEIEIRSGPLGELRRGDRAPARAPHPALRAAPPRRAWRWPRPAPIPGPTTSTSGSSTRRTTSASRTTSARSPSATTPGACTSTWASAAPTGRSPSATGCASCCRCCWPSPPTRPSSTGATPACTRSGPRSSPAPSRAAGFPARSTTGRRYADFVGLLERTGSVVESTQLWWSVRPHHLFGTVEVRICDAQTRGEESFALAGLIVRLHRPDGARLRRARLRGPRRAARRPRDRGEPLAGDPLRDGRRDDRLPPRRSWSRPKAALEQVLAWTEPARSQLGIEVALPPLNGAQRARADREGGRPIEEIYREAVAETMATYGAAGSRTR